MMLIEKYKPNRIKDIIGQSDALQKLVLCFKNKKHVLICGPAGCGKTSSILTIANEFGFDIIELNSSNFRNKAKINEIVGNSIKQQSLFSESKIILIDELEGLSGRKDRGCINEINKLIVDSQYQIVLICNKMNKQIAKLKKKAHLIEFKELDHRLILAFLQKICKDEGLKVNDVFLKNVACSCRGDVRAAINDLNALNLSFREKEENIQDSLKLVFKSNCASSVLNAFNNIDEDLDECLLWVDENLPKEYNKKDLQRAYEYLSKADIFKKRIKRWQYYGLLSYINTFLTAGIAVSKEKPNNKDISYKRSARILKMWIAKQRNMKRKEIARKIATQCHCSLKKIMAEMPYLEIINSKK